jgi:hypothetical protein
MLFVLRCHKHSADYDLISDESIGVSCEAVSASFELVHKTNILTATAYIFGDTKKGAYYNFISLTAWNNFDAQATLFKKPNKWKCHV